MNKSEMRNGTARPLHVAESITGTSQSSLSPEAEPWQTVFNSSHIGQIMMTTSDDSRLHRRGNRRPMHKPRCYTLNSQSRLRPQRTLTSGTPSSPAHLCPSWREIHISVPR